MPVNYYLQIGFIFYNATSDPSYFEGKINIAAASGTSAGIYTAGTVSLVSGTVTVNTTAVTTNSIIILTAQSGTLTGVLKVSSRTGGTSFVISSSILTDTANIGWLIIN